MDSVQTGKEWLDFLTYQCNGPPKTVKYLHCSVTQHVCRSAFVSFNHKMILGTVRVLITDHSYHTALLVLSPVDEALYVVKQK